MSLIRGVRYMATFYVANRTGYNRAIYCSSHCHSGTPKIDIVLLNMKCPQYEPWILLIAYLYPIVDQNAELVAADPRTDNYVHNDEHDQQGGNHAVSSANSLSHPLLANNDHVFALNLTQLRCRMEELGNYRHSPLNCRESNYLNVAWLCSGYGSETRWLGVEAPFRSQSALSE